MGPRSWRHEVVEVWQRLHVEEHGLPQAEDQVRHLPVRYDLVCGQRELGNRGSIRYTPLWLFLERFYSKTQLIVLSDADSR
jgi:hypothetical protein